MKNIVWKNGSELPAEKREQLIGMLCDEIKKRYCFYSVEDAMEWGIEPDAY